MSSKKKAPLDTVDLSLRLEDEEYRERLKALQASVRQLAYRLYEAGRALVVVFEGWDAAGKGGAVRRFTEYLDPRGYQVYPIAVPKGDSAVRHYLWRFWRRLEPPRDRQIQIFDRSWYGRVLVERVEGFATKREWKRAYEEINDFERQLTDAGITVVKFWIHLSPEEQLRRFEQRDITPHKQWKLTGEDWRNREKWSQYEEAVNDMIERTSTETAPWTLVAGEDKHHARVRVLEVLEAGLKQAVGSATPERAASASD